MTEALALDHQRTVVYHYCDANALLSILTNRMLWYTHAAYLNDTMEIKAGVEICQALLHEMLESEPNDPVLESAKSYLANAEMWQYYVCCFSEGKDKLSQWRAYANDGDGFSIGLKMHYLSPGFDSPFGCELNRVSYDESCLKNRFDSVVNELRSDLAELPEDTDEYQMRLCRDHAAAVIGGWCIEQSVFHKDAGFSEEEEWRSTRSHRLEDFETEGRLIAEGISGDFVQVLHRLQQEAIERRLIRSGRYGLTPYIEVTFQPQAISEVVCGPKTAKDLTESSLEIMKKRLGLEFAISRSTATYR